MIASRRLLPAAESNVEAVASSCLPCSSINDMFSHAECANKLIYRPYMRPLSHTCEGRGFWLATLLAPTEFVHEIVSHF